MNGAHIHLMVNHLPIVGSALALLVLLLAAWRREKGYGEAGALLLFVSGLGGLAALLSGESAEKIVEQLAGTSAGALESHEERGQVAAWISMAAAALSLPFLYKIRSTDVAPRRWILGACVLAFAAFSASAFAGLAGGQIRHPEISSPSTPATLSAED